MPVCGGAPWLGFCLQQAGSPSAEMQGIITQRKASHLGSFSSYGRKEEKITAEVAGFHKSESDLFCFTDFTLKRKKKKILEFQVESGLSGSGCILTSLSGKNLCNRSKCLRTLCPAPLKSGMLSTSPGWAASPSREKSWSQQQKLHCRAPCPWEAPFLSWVQKLALSEARVITILISCSAYMFRQSYSFSQIWKLLSENEFLKSHYHT